MIWPTLMEWLGVWGSVFAAIALAASYSRVKDGGWDPHERLNAWTKARRGWIILFGMLIVTQGLTLWYAPHHLRPDHSGNVPWSWGALLVVAACAAWPLLEREHARAAIADQIEPLSEP